MSTWKCHMLKWMQKASVTPPKMPRKRARSSLVSIRNSCTCEHCEAITRH